MPPQATFDYYATLEVGKTAALQEIKDSYRRLALVHHPDKNPDDPEAATAAFQKIQTAYETLSDQSRRAKYDARTSQASQHPSSAGPSSSPYPWESDDDDGYDLFDDGFPISTPFGDFISDGRGGFRSAGFGFGFFGGRGEPSPFGGPTSDAGRAWRDAASEMLREEDRRHGEDRRREKEREEKIKEREERLKEEAAKKQKKEEAKKEAEAAKIRVRDESRRAEQLKQETRWEVSGAKTEEDKLEACLHSEYCVKISQQKKFKCGACGVKRGITAFKCPYCSLLLCQQCVVTFTKKRASAENPRPAQTTPTFKPQTEPELATQPEEQESDQESVADLISGFKQRQQKNAGKHGSSAGKKKSKAKADGAQNDSKTRPAQSQPDRLPGWLCYNCGEEGHSSRDCPNDRKPKKGSRTCYACGEKGHISRACPKSQSQSYAE